MDVRLTTREMDTISSVLSQYMLSVPMDPDELDDCESALARITEMQEQAMRARHAAAA